MLVTEGGAEMVRRSVPTALPLLLAVGCAPDLPSAERAIREWHRAGGVPPLERVEVAPVEGTSGLFVARCDTQADWWGFFCCTAIRRGRVLWEASPDETPSEQSIHSVRGRVSAVTGRPLLEVVGKTHMGNGFLYVYDLRGRRLRRVLHTRAYDANLHERHAFAGAALGIQIRDDAAGGLLEIELSGTIEEYDASESRRVRSWPCGKVFVWDPLRERFAQDPARRRGFDGYPEAEVWPD